MKKKALCFLLMCLSAVSLSGCTLPFSTDSKTIDPKDIEPPYYLSEAELPNDAFYIVRDVTYDKESLTGKTESVTETRYYPLLQAENTLKEVPSSPVGYDASRIEWVNYNIDEGKIPTMYAQDKMIYKSPTMIPTKYSLEKFFDEGYTLGIMGLKQDTSGNYRYYGKDGGAYTMSTSDATGLDGLKDVESIYLAQVGDQRVTPLNVSPSGTVTGLKKNKTYKCDIRRGTKEIDAKLTANIHYYSSAETYFFGSFTFITPEIAQINIPSYVMNGYYNIGSAGFFRYITDETVTNWKDLDTDSFNQTLYTYDEYGHVDGTNTGLIFDENGFLVPGVLTDSDGNPVERAAIDYDESAATKESEKKINITKPTKLTPKDGCYAGIYHVTNMSEPTLVGSKAIYDIEAVNLDNDETLNMRYTKTASTKDISVNGEYGFVFKEAGNGFDGYEIITVTDANDPSVAVTEETNTEETNTEETVEEVAED